MYLFILALSSKLLTYISGLIVISIWLSLILSLPVSSSTSLLSTLNMWYPNESFKTTQKQLIEILGLEEKRLTKEEVTPERLAKEYDEGILKRKNLGLEGK